MVRQGSLVTLNVDWTCVNGTRRIVDNHCLVSWEISGGGLIGNLLTDATSAELSLWTNAKYHIQVTCKNKVSEEWFQSQSLTVDTRSAKNVTLTSTPAPTTAEDTPLYLDQTEELDALDNFEETDAILQIHRAKDKDVKTTQEQDNTENAIDVQIYPIISKYRFRQLFTANPVSGIWRIYEGKKEFVLGVILAIILFLILSILVINTKRKSRLVHKVYLMSSYKIDAADYEEERKDERRVKRIVQKKRPRHDGVEILQRDEKIIHV